MKNLNCFKSFNDSHQFVFFQEKSPSHEAAETAQSAPAPSEKTDKLEPKQIVEVLERAGFQNARLETEASQKWKLDESERKMPGVPREELPADHPDNEKVPTEISTYRFSYRGIDASFQVIRQESGNVTLGVDLGKFGLVVKAQDWDKAMSKVKSSIEQNDPNFFKELMIKEGFKDVSFREEGEGGYPTYDFVLDNGQKGNIVRLRSGNGFSLACNREGHDTIAVNAPTLAEGVSKVMDLIKVGDME